VKAITTLISPIGSLLTGTGLFAKKVKAVEPPVTPIVPTRNAAADAMRRDDALRRRRGAGANELTGGGAEAVTPGGKTLLGQ
jgi:hypothetical protein